jgi:hypothetical protein
MPSFKITMDEQIKITGLGRKLALFVAALSVSDKEKGELFAAIQEMSIEELEKLAEIADKFYVESKTVEIDEKFKNDLSAIKKEYEEKNEKIDKNFLKKLADLENNLKK